MSAAFRTNLKNFGFKLGSVDDVSFLKLIFVRDYLFGLCFDLLKFAYKKKDFISHVLCSGVTHTLTQNCPRWSRKFEYKYGPFDNVFNVKPLYKIVILAKKLIKINIYLFVFCTELKLLQDKDINWNKLLHVAHTRLLYSELLKGKEKSKIDPTKDLYKFPSVF
ncbi:hypothetical protein BpHYR1_049214 [Brachionus plicatilis]|uniref:Uncharacterized protein n=1 Tax=Brachionus plicatilis TaxID=10195 RepID=A0A3M7RX89_BRAPC|nr:hypothetical protein BpHYR1_049214 [Brachionus plicatilis]